jgi:hypothetical protein
VGSGHVSEELDKIMSGEGDVFSLADIIDNTQFPNSSRESLEFVGAASTSLTRMSSVDPIDGIEKSGTSGTSTSGPIVIVDDDPSDDIVEEIRSGQRCPGTPKGETMFESGRVKNMVNSQDKKQFASSGQTALGDFLQPIPSSNRASNSAAKSKSSGKGNPITPGYTRNGPSSGRTESSSVGGSISSRMKNKKVRHEVSWRNFESSNS